MVKPPSPLRNLRRRRSISQEDLARIAKIPQSSLSKAEVGKLRLRPDVEELIATILGGTRAELFPADDNGPTT